MNFEELQRHTREVFRQEAVDLLTELESAFARASFELRKLIA